MKLCICGHPKGTNLDCPKCQHSARSKNLWASLKSTGRDCITVAGLSSAEAVEKRRLYFSSDLHKQRASHQARQLALDRRNGLKPPCRNKICDTKLELAVVAVLQHLKIVYHKQYQLGPYTFDFFLPDYSILIEVDGEWAHSQPNSIANDLTKDSYIYNQYKYLRLVRIPEIQTKDPQKLLEFLADLTKSNRSVIDIDENLVAVSPITFDIAQVFLASHGYLPRFRRNTKLAHGIFYDREVIGALIYTGTTSSTPNICSIRPQYAWTLFRKLVLPDYDIIVDLAITKSLELLKLDKDVHLVVSPVELVGWVSVGQEWVYFLSDVRHAVKTQPTIDAVCACCGLSAMVTKEAYRRAIKKHGAYRHQACAIKMGWQSGVYENRPKRVEKDGNGMVEVECACGYRNTIKQKSLDYAIRRFGSYRCISCGVKASQDRSI